MVVVRPIRPADLDDLVELCGLAGHGLTTLPRDADLLRRRIAKSVRSFAADPDEPGAESYLFVLEDTESGRVVGTSALTARVGGFEPFYTFRLETHRSSSAALGVEREIGCLHLAAECSGPAALGSLLLAPDQRGRGQGRLMSLSRFLFAAEHPGRFEPTVLAEMRGPVDDDGRCPFWEAVGKHFFGMEFPEADYLTLTNKRFIADLVPGHPLFVPLLAPEGQAAIGQVHRDTRAALRLLEDEGFRRTDRIDPFDGGPVVLCAVAEVRTVRESRRVRVDALSEEVPGAEPFLVAGTSLDFRACLAGVAPGPEGGVVLSRAAAEALAVGEGDLVRYAPLRPGRKAVSP